MTATVQTEVFAEREVTITRVFDAPRALVFKAWTDPQRLAQWWGPHGYTTPVCDIERARRRQASHPRTGAGRRRATAMEGVFRDVVAPERLVFEQHRRSMAGQRMLEGLATVTFAEQRRQDHDDGARARRCDGRRWRSSWLRGMNEGWTQTIERLEAS